MKLEVGKVHHLNSSAAADTGAASKEALDFSHEICFIFVEEQSRVQIAADDSTVDGRGRCVT